jgi:hypothetical protein
MGRARAQHIGAACRHKIALFQGAFAARAAKRRAQRRLPISQRHLRQTYPFVPKTPAFAPARAREFRAMVV